MFVGLVFNSLQCAFYLLLFDFLLCIPAISVAHIWTHVTVRYYYSITELAPLMDEGRSIIRMFRTVSSFYVLRQLHNWMRNGNS